MLRWATALGLFAAVVVGCSGPSAGGSSSAPSAGVASPNPAGSHAVSVPPEVLEPLVADAAARASVEPSAVTTVEASPETWPNGALGCPTPGVMYTQAIVNGWRVVLAAGTEQFDYRSSGPGRFRLCTSGAPGGGSPGGSGTPG